jgi:hypothetical protein
LLGEPFLGETKAVRRRRPGEFQQVQQDLDLRPDADVELDGEERLERHVLPLLHPVQLPFPPLVLVERVLRALGALGLLLMVERVADDRLLRLELLAVLVQRQDLRNVVNVLVRAPGRREEDGVDQSMLLVRVGGGVEEAPQAGDEEVEEVTAEEVERERL